MDTNEARCDCPMQGHQQSVCIRVHLWLMNADTTVRRSVYRVPRSALHCPSTHAKISGATMVASDSMMNFGVFSPSLPQVIFSFGTAPE